MPLAECNSTLLNFNRIPDLPSLRNGISDSQYCAYDPNGMKDSCEGDSGGPLHLIGNSTEPTKIVGIVSFGPTRSCGSSLPGIYTRVASYIYWISSTVWPKNKIIPPLVNQARISQLG